MDAQCGASCHVSAVLELLPSRWIASTPRSLRFRVPFADKRNTGVRARDRRAGRNGSREESRPDWEKSEAPPADLGFVCVVLASFPLFHFGYSAQRASVRADFNEAVDFAIHNPSAQIPPRLLPVIRAVLPDFDDNETFAFLKKGRDERALQKEFEGT